MQTIDGQFTERRWEMGGKKEEEVNTRMGKMELNITYYLLLPDDTTSPLPTGTYLTYLRCPL